MKKILCIDFDGVLHSYSSGWQGADVANDSPVPGAIEWLVLLVRTGQFEPMIYSSRSSQQGGIDCMKAWLTRYGMDDESLAAIKFPTQKPAAFLTIDDRAICFQGAFPTLSELVTFTPWNKHGESEMRDQWFWLASADEEQYTIGPCATRDEAIELATKDELGLSFDDTTLTFHVVEAVQRPLKLADYFDASEWFDQLNDGQFDDIADPNGDYFLDVVSFDHRQTLQDRIRATIQQWQDEHKIVLSPWSFDETRNGEWVTINLKSEEGETK